MKVLMISKALIVGAYHDKLRELARQGVDLTVVLPHRWGNQKPELAEAADYKIRVLPCGLSGYNHFHFHRSQIGPIDADLVHIDEDPWSLVTHQWMRACVKGRKPAIFFTWQNIHKRYPFPFQYFESYSFRNAAAGIAGNDEARRILVYRKFAKPISVIPQFGVDPDSYCRRDSGELRRKFGLENRFIVGFAGRIVKEKGIVDLLCAFARLSQRCALVLLGAGDFQPDAEHLANRLGVASRIRWIPYVPSLEMPKYMSLLNVLVLPSRTTPKWKEQFGRVLIEAMASETAVVGSNSGEIPAVIGNAGLVFPEGDDTALAAQLARLEAEPQFLKQLSVAGRARVLQNFTNRQVASKTAEFYERTLTELRLPFFKGKNASEKVVATLG